MQFLESSILGLRAARHRLTAPDHPAEVTLYPMIHVGLARFFETVETEALGHDAVLVEGVRSRASWFLTRAYRWAPLKRLGLVAQTPIRPQAGGAEVILADVTPGAFDRLWRGLPLWLRAAVTLGAPAYGLWLRATASRATLARGQCTTDLADRDLTLAPGTPADGLLSVILHARDENLARVLGAELDKAKAAPEPPRRIAVVYGAAHMPAVLAELRRHGAFRPVDSAWLEAIPL